MSKAYEPPKKRWQFSLRGLFVLMAGFGVWLAVHVAIIRHLVYGVPRPEPWEYGDATNFLIAFNAFALCSLYCWAEIRRL